MSTKRPVKPSTGKDKDAASVTGKKPRSGKSRQDAPGRAAAKQKKSSGVSRGGEDLYNRLFLDNHAVMLLIDPQDGRIVDANGAAVRFYGYAAAKLKSMRISDINVLDPGEIRLRMGSAVKGRQRDFLFRHRLANGAIRDVEVHSGPIVLGGRTLLYSIVRDITERRRAETDLRFEREQLLSMFDSMETLVYVTDPSTNEILYVNRALQNVLGRPVVGHICYREFQGLEAPCPFCTNEIILKQYPAPHYWEYYNPKMGRHFSITDRMIKWPDGRDVRVEFATDITERVRAQEAVREERDFSAAVLDTAGALVVVLDREGRITRFNRACEALTGYSASEVMGRVFWEFLVPPAELQGVQEKWEALCSGDFPNRHENDWASKDGVRHRISWSNTAITRGPGDVEYVIGTGVDITPRKHAEEAQRASERRYRLLVDNAEIAVVITSMTTGKVLFANPRAHTLFDVRVDEAVGRRARDHWVRPEDRDHFVEELTKAGRVSDYECALQTATGEARWVIVSANVIDYAGDRAAFVVYNDITDRKRAEEALRDSLETASAMFNAATESFALIDADGTVLAANETFALRLGMKVDAIVGTSVYGYMDAAVAGHRRERMREVIDRGHPLRFSDERSGGWFESSLYPIFDSRGRVSRIVIYAQDITDRRRSEEALRQSEALLKSIFQAAPIGIGIVYNRVIGWTNDQVADMLGYSVEDLAEKNARILYDSDEEFERVGREKYVEVLQGETGSIETRWRHKDGTLLDILLSSKAIDPADPSSGIVFTALDITDRKRTEEALQRYQDELEQRVRERTTELMVANQALILEIEDRRRAESALRDSERRLSDIISFLPDATFVIDRDGKVIAWNRSMETMTGIAARDILGRGDYEYALPFYGKRRPMLIDIALSGDAASGGRHARIVKRGGVFFGESYIPGLQNRTDRVYLSGTAAPLYDAHGNVVGAVESIRDVSERKRAEEELRYRDAILEVASFAAERFLKAPSWETDIREILARLGTVTGASRVYIFENRIDEDGTLLVSQRYEWVSEDIEPQMGNAQLQDHAMEEMGFARWAAIMRQGRPLHGLVRELPESERPLLESQGILSIAAVPVSQGDRWWGFIGFDDCLREREWSDIEMEALSVVASTLSAALSRKHAEARLVQTSERLSVVLESLPVVTFTAAGGEAGEITYISGTVEEVTGFRPEAFLKDPAFFQEHVHPDDRPHVRANHAEIGTKGMSACEFRFRAANGSYRWFSEFCRLTRGPEGSIGRIVGMWQDVTDEKRILQESNTRLQQVIQAHKLASLGEVVAGVVHEINNPNSFIAYNVPLLEEIWKLCEPVVAEHASANPGWGKRGVSIEELRSDMEEIINAFRIGSDRINRVVSNLKDFARVEDGVQARPVSVNDVVEKTLMIVGGQIRRSVSRLEVDLGAGLPLVQGHFQKLEQVMANLLVNAHQSTPDREKGRIRVATRHIQRLGAVAITVEDNGVGMTRPVLDRLFEPFFTMRRDTGGTGLGLSVSYGLIQEHQGVIGVLSRPGIGSRFTVFLPVKPGPPLSLRPLILPLESDLDRLEEMQMEMSGIDDGFVHWFYHHEPSAERLAEYLDQHPEVDVLLMTELPAGLGAGVLLRAVREKFPLVTTIAWGSAEKEFTGPDGEKPDIFVKDRHDMRKLKGVIEGLTRQRF